VLVVDTSAIIDALVHGNSATALADRLAGDGDLHAPHLIDVELLHALRRLERRTELSGERADDVRADFAALPVTRYPQLGLGERIWQLRHNLTAYDAAYVALAEALEVPLITCDSRLAAAPGHHADVEVFEAQSRSVDEESAEGAPAACDP